MSNLNSFFCCKMLSLFVHLMLFIRLKGIFFFYCVGYNRF